MRVAGVPFYPANGSNYTPGRGGNVVKYITIHHSAGWENTLRYLWADPNRNGSSHFWVGNNPGQIEQYVDTDDTAWCNGNWTSNQQSISIEVRGDWRGYYDQTTLNNLETLLTALRRAYPSASITYHKDVSSTFTLCPADLKDKGWAKTVWDKVTGIIWPSTPPAPAISYTAITPKRIKLIRNANLWNFNFTSWANAKAVQLYQAGEVIDVVAVATNALGAKYYMTAYSFNGGAVRATNGFNIADCEDYVPQITQPPVVAPAIQWEDLEGGARKLRVAQPVFITNLENYQTQGNQLAVGTEVEIVDKTTGTDKVMYVRSKWSKENGKNWGIRMDHLAEIQPDVPREPVPEPPIVTDPTTPGNGDAAVIEKSKVIEFLLSIVKLITDFIAKLTNKG